MTTHWNDPKQRLESLRQVLAGRYRLGSLLDRGGVADIYLATTLQPPHKQVAVKLLRPFLALDDDIAAMFRDEITILRQLNHPHVVRTIEGSPHTTPSYLVMEYVQGCNLAVFHNWLQTRSAPPHWSLAVNIAEAILKALDYLHNARDQDGNALHLIHRDLSPPNVLLGEAGEIKLTDFGIAIYRDMSRETEGKDPKGRFSYLAPEMLQGIPIDQRADIFSWGIFVWELLTGHRLFASSTPEETMKLVSDAPILSPRAFAPDIPEELEQIVMQALQRDREKRHFDTSTLRKKLSAFTKKHPVEKHTSLRVWQQIPFLAGGTTPKTETD